MIVVGIGSAGAVAYGIGGVIVVDSCCMNFCVERKYARCANLRPENKNV